MLPGRRPDGRIACSPARRSTTGFTFEGKDGAGVIVVGRVVVCEYGGSNAQSADCTPFVASPPSGEGALGQMRFAWPQAPGDAEPAAGPPAASR